MAKAKEKEVAKVNVHWGVEEQPDYKAFIAELKSGDRWTHEGIESLIKKHKINEK